MVQGDDKNLFNTQFAVDMLDNAAPHNDNK